ncbi:MAG: zinc ribbon domain-containing protein [Pseudomonadota bacterium]
MPIHDYQCERCKQRFELLVMPNQKPVCPGCGGRRLERLFPTSAAVSTSRTRGLSLAGARSKAGVEKKDKDMAHAEYLRKHERDHS